LNTFKPGSRLPSDDVRHVAVIGLGLIGGSLAHALARANVNVVAHDTDPATRERAAEVPGLSVAGDVAGAAAGADLVVVAVPLPAVADVLAGLDGYRGLLTDVVSVKAEMRALVSAGPATGTYVGAHPMAGSDRSGFDAADPDLLVGCPWVLCLEEDTALPAWCAVARLLTGALGARVVPATAAEHDAAVARISHLPHVLAAALAEAAGSGDASALARTLAAGSFRDGTRVAGTRPDLVAAMCGGNAAALVPALEEAIAHLSEAKDLLTGPDPIPALTGWLRAGYEVRARWPAAAGEPYEVPIEPDALLALGRRGGWVTAVSPTDDTATAVEPDPR
jgi:prephenate dehydrogenase